MSLQKKDVEYVATLARLALSEEETETLTRQLGGILEYVATLSELDTEAIPPTSHVLPLSNVLREDEVVPSAPREERLALAPEQEQGHFKVPKIIADSGA